MSVHFCLAQCGDGGNRKTERDGASRGRTNFQQKIMSDRTRTRGSRSVRFDKRTAGPAEGIEVFRC